MDEDLVAAELAALDAIADRPEGGDEALCAALRAWALRRLPAACAAAVLREESMRALMNGYSWRDQATPANVVWRLGVIAQRVGVPGWSYLPMGMEVRAKVNALKRRQLAAKTQARKAAQR